MQIDRESDVFPRDQLAAWLREGIRAGRWLPGKRIPSLASLAAEHDLAMMTVQRAVKIIRNEGYVHTVKALGSFVNAPHMWPEED